MDNLVVKQEDAEEETILKKLQDLRLVIDDIDRMEPEDSNQQKSSKHEEESIDWLPLCFPDSFRVIIT